MSCNKIFYNQIVFLVEFSLAIDYVPVTTLPLRSLILNNPCL